GGSREGVAARAMHPPPSRQRRRKRSGLLEFRPNLLAADIDLPSTRPILPACSGLKVAGSGDRGHGRPPLCSGHINRAQLVGDHALFRGLRRPPGAKGFGRTWGGDCEQTTLRGVAIAILLALGTAVVGPLFVDWSSYRGEFEARASRLTGLDFRVTGAIDARLLPTPTLTLEGLEFGRPEEGSKVRARLLRIEFALGALARGEWRIADARLEGPEFSAGLDGSGRLAWPVPKLGFSLESVSIARLHIQDGRASLADAANDGHLVLEKLEFTGELRSLAGPVKGDGSFVVAG